MVNNGPATIPVGDTTVVWKATDPGGLFDVATQTVTVTDTVPPAVVAPVGPVVKAASKFGGVAEFTVSATDIVDPATDDDMWTRVRFRLPDRGSHRCRVSPRTLLGNETETQCSM